MAKYRISKSYSVDLIIEANNADAAFEIAEEAKLDLRVDTSNPKVLAATTRFTGTATTHKDALTQEQIATRAQAKALEVARAKAVTDAKRKRDSYIQDLLRGRNA